MARSDAQHLVKEVASRLKTAQTDVQSSDITAAFIESMGGVPGLVGTVVREFNASPPGSLIRAKLIETMLRGLRDQPKGVGDISTLEEAELRRLLADTTRQLAEEGDEQPARPADPAGPDAEAGPPEEGPA